MELMDFERVELVWVRDVELNTGNNELNVYWNFNELAVMNR